MTALHGFEQTRQRRIDEAVIMNRTVLMFLRNKDVLQPLAPDKIVQRRANVTRARVDVVAVGDPRRVERQRHKIARARFAATSGASLALSRGSGAHLSAASHPRSRKIAASQAITSAPPSG